MPYTTITTEGGLLPADILDAIAAGELAGQRAEDFGFERGRNLTDEIAAAWAAVRGAWQTFQFFVSHRLREGDPGTSLTRERWVLPLLDVLGYQLNYNQTAHVVEGRTYAISHRAGAHEDAPPVHVEGIRASLDARPPSGRPRLSPHALLQEYLNSTEQLWGIVTNGERLRLLRDSSRFTRPTYVEFDLRAMFEGEKFSEFALLYRLIHRSRLPQDSADASSCLLEKYHQQAVETGGRVREKLRDGVEIALKTLGNGLLEHPANAALRAKLEGGQLTPLTYYRQLLKLIYRLLFLMVAEERGLIATGTRRLMTTDDDPFEITSVQSFDALLSSLVRGPSVSDRLKIYYDHYSVARLRRLAEAPGAGRGRYGDLWQGLLATFRLFEGSDEQSPRSLGLAALDGDLFGQGACVDLTEGTQLGNADLLRAIRALSLYREKESKALRRVNYGALDVEELGSVYESLLDFRPFIQLDANEPFALVTGTERKTTGSYYTRPELVQELIKSALGPVIEERLRGAADKQQVLLSIKVCDPACGSGHFLLAAARRIGRELARVRSGEEQPTPTDFRRAVRDVIQHCIYGVDLNPLAVDLCKLALWLEGHNAGMPLSFLDHHIKQGNSLIGATRALVDAGIPDDAYKAVTGDDKTTASAIKKRNKQERELAERGMRQPSLFDAPTADHGPTLAEELDRLDATVDDSVAAVRAKAAHYRKLRDAVGAERIRFDLWTAAFFQPLTPENARYVPTTKHLHDARPGDNKAIQAEALASEVGFFHWELEFPQVFEGTTDDRRLTTAKDNDSRSSVVGGWLSGFDVVLGNPPWERIKLQEQEHWVDVPEIRDAPNKAAREKAIQGWRNGDERQRARVALFDAAKYRAEAESRFVRASSRFPLTAVGDVNTYALFAEHARDLLAPMGRAGIIVPTGIATADTTKRFFETVVDSSSIESLFDFLEARDFFVGLESRDPFCLLTLSNNTTRNERPARFIFKMLDLQELKRQERLIYLTPSDFALLNPNTRTCPMLRTQADAELTKKIYRNTAILIDERTGRNPWGVSYLRMFDMANDSHLFANSAKPDLLPLYESRLLHQFTHRWASYENGESRDFKREELANPYIVIQPRYWVSREDIAQRLLNRWSHKWLMAFRDVCRANDERTAIFSVIPRVGVNHKAPIILPSEQLPVLQTPCLISVFDSLVFDFVARQKVGGTSLSYFILNQLPVLPPDAFSEADVAFIVPRVLELVYTAWDMKPFAEDVWAEADESLCSEILRRSAECNVGAPADLFAPRDGFALPPFRWNDERRALIRADLDARIAKLYGLTRDELRYILDPMDVYGPDFPGETFRVLKEKEIRQFGEYRTRRLVLEAWDRAGY